MRSGLSLNGIAALCTPRPWTPVDLTGLLGFWVVNSPYCFTNADKTSSCGSGDGIRVWSGIVGGDITQATSANRPAFNLEPARATFDGLTDWMGSWATGSPTGLFSFHRIKTSTLGYHNIYDNIVGDFVMAWVDDAGRIEPDAQALGVWGSGPIITDNAWHTLFLWRSSTVATRMWIDGSEITPGAGTGVRTIPANLDLFGRAGTTPFNGSASAFGFASALPSTGDLARLQQYLAGLR